METWIGMMMQWWLSITKKNSYLIMLQTCWKVLYETKNQYLHCIVFSTVKGLLSSIKLQTILQFSKLKPHLPSQKDIIINTFCQKSMCNVLLSDTGIPCFWFHPALETSWILRTIYRFFFAFHLFFVLQQRVKNMMVKRLVGV